jgi:hypothetical protein
MGTNGSLSFHLTKTGLLIFERRAADVHPKK